MSQGIVLLWEKCHELENILKNAEYDRVLVCCCNLNKKCVNVFVSCNIFDQHIHSSMKCAILGQNHTPLRMIVADDD